MAAESTFWKPEDLGQPIPNDRHAVSVCLPQFKDNIGYEEGEPRVINAMRGGYPRFFLHPLVSRLFAYCEEQFAVDNECAFVFPSKKVASRCQQFLQANNVASRIVPFTTTDSTEQATVVLVDQGDRSELKAYWQHSGEIISSRRAEQLLSTKSQTASNSPAPSDVSEAKQLIRQRLAETHGCPAEDVWLFPSGMAAIFTTYRLFQQLRPNARSVQFGFPYVDILKVQQRFATAGAPAVEFLPRAADEDLDRVEQLASSETLQGLFVEIPGNPLLTTPNVIRLCEIGRKFNFPIMIDDTVGALTNLQTLPHADVVCTSLTKYFSGAGNVIAGALVLNRESRHFAQLAAALDREFEDLFFEPDALVLEANSRDFAERVTRINSNTQAVAQFLAESERVESVYYPGSCEGKTYSSAGSGYPAFNLNYKNVMRPEAGFGGLLSFVLKDAARHTPAFFDRLALPKGPNLGTSFTLCCPFTILAHYDELDFVEGLGVSRYLIRVAVGTEDPLWIVNRFRSALEEIEDD